MPAKRKILVVDDIALNREILCDILSVRWDTEQASNGREALEILDGREDEFGLICLDIVMPELDGYGVLDELDRRNLLDTLPVIVISAAESGDNENKSLSAHATDFIHKPFDEQVVLHRVQNVYDLYDYKRSLEDKVEAQTAEIRESNKVLKEQSDRIQAFNENITSLLGITVEYRDTESGEHIQRVRAYTELLAKEIEGRYKEYGLTATKIDVIARASVLHDLGKIAIPDAILLKPGKLTAEEFEIMKSHTVKGEDLLKQVKDSWDMDFGDVARVICRHHHERYDGKGYPDGLAGDDIPIAAQLVSVADVYDALVNERPYKRAFSHEEAVQMILNGECGTFNPKLMKAFESIAPTFAAVSQSL